MSHKTSSSLFVLFTLIASVIVIVSLTTPAQAQSIPASESEDKCRSCHEDLYFLHDTGNWFCLRESSMRCVDCHGGDPEAIIRETAHTNRAAHPVINEDVSKCRECHPEKCNERVGLFDQAAGISQVRVAAPYSPAYSTESVTNRTTDASQPDEQPGDLFMFRELIPLAVLVGLALIIYLIRRHFTTNSIKKEQRK